MEKIKEKSKLKGIGAKILAFDIILHSLASMGGLADTRDYIIRKTESTTQNSCVKNECDKLLSTKEFDQLLEKQLSYNDFYKKLKPGQLLAFSRILPSDKIEPIKDISENQNKFNSVMADINDPIEFGYSLMAKTIGTPNFPILHLAYVDNIDIYGGITIIESQSVKNTISKRYSKSNFKNMIEDHGGVILLEISPDLEKKLPDLDIAINKSIGSLYDTQSSIKLGLNSLFETEYFQSTPDNKYNCTELIFSGLKDAGIIPKNKKIDHLSAKDLVASGVFNIAGFTQKTK